MAEQITLYMEPGIRLLRQCSSKADCRVDLLQRADGSKFIQRTYDHPIPAYEALLDHRCSHLPAIYRCRRQGGLFLVEEEFVDGLPLSEVLEMHRPDSAQASAIVRQLCEALSVLHGSGFVHRDVKPENILLTSTGRVVLLDLDASTEQKEEKNQDTRLLGTVGYAAPEQFGFGRSDVRTDIFSVGVLLNVLCTGEHPSQQLETGVLAPVIERCIEVNSDKRYPSAEELLRHLPATAPANICPHCGFLTPGGGCIHCGRPGKFRRSRRWIPAAAAALAVLTGLTGWLLGRSKPEPEPPAPAVQETIQTPEAEAAEPEAPVIPAPQDTPQRPLTDADVVPWMNCDEADALAPFTLNGRTYYLHPDYGIENFPNYNHGISYWEPRTIPLRFGFWEMTGDSRKYRKVTDPTLLTQIEEAFYVRDEQGNVVIDISGKPVSSLTMSLHAMTDQETPLPEHYPACRYGAEQDFVAYPLTAEMTPETEGFWRITASGTANGQPVEASIHMHWQHIDLITLEPDAALETPVVQQVNEALAACSPEEDSVIEVRLPAGTFTGYIEIPENLAGMIVNLQGSWEGTTVLCGGVRNAYGECGLYDLHLIGAGKDLEQWPADSPNTGYPNEGFYGDGGGVAFQCVFEDYACAMRSTFCLRTGADNTYLRNGIAIHFCTNQNVGGNGSLHSNTFQSNDTAIRFEKIPPQLTLSWFDFYHNHFQGNGTDIDNLTGDILNTSDSVFLDENGLPK